MLVALQFAAAQPFAFRIWEDCLGVVRRVQGLLQGGKVAPTSRNADLWTCVLEQLPITGDRYLGIYKGASHTDLVVRVDYQANMARTTSFCRIYYSDVETGKQHGPTIPAVLAAPVLRNYAFQFAMKII